AGDPGAERILFSALDTLGQALATIVSSVGSLPVVIGGGLAEGASIVLDTLRGSIVARLGMMPAPPALPSSLGMWAGCQGDGRLGRSGATEAGPTGDAGRSGPTGAGPAGTPGPTGSTAAPGSVGSPGPVGLPGSAEAPGPTGSAGPAPPLIAAEARSRSSRLPRTLPWTAPMSSTRSGCTARTGCARCGPPRAAKGSVSPGSSTGP